jgi:hypothetical protein
MQENCALSVCQAKDQRNGRRMWAAQKWRLFVGPLTLGTKHTSRRARGHVSSVHQHPTEPLIRRREGGKYLRLMKTMWKGQDERHELRKHPHPLLPLGPAMGAFPILGGSPPLSSCQDLMARAKDDAKCARGGTLSCAPQPPSNIAFALERHALMSCVFPCQHASRARGALDHRHGPDTESPTYTFGWVSTRICSSAAPANCFTVRSLNAVLWPIWIKNP